MGVLEDKKKLQALPAQGSYRYSEGFLLRHVPTELALSRVDLPLDGPSFFCSYEGGNDK